MAAGANTSSRKRGGDVAWADFPPDLLRLITVFLPSMWDLVRFRGVCSSWRSAANPKDRPPQFPSLLLPYDRRTTVRSFLDPTDRRVHTIDIPEARGKWIYCTPQGWLVMLGEDVLMFAVSLLNPITRAHILLPPLTCLKNDPLPSHAVLSGNPSLSQPGHEPFLALMFDESRLCVCRLGDGETWRMINLGIPSDPHLQMRDLAYFDGEFYAVDNYKGITIYNTRTGLKRYNAPASRKSMYFADTLHLVESCGDLLLLERVWLKRYWDIPYYVEVIIFKLDRVNRSKLKWVRIQESIGDRTFFLSPHHISVSLSSRDFNGGRQDQICFAEINCIPSNPNKVHAVHICITNLIDGRSTLNRPNYEDSKEVFMRNQYWYDRLTWIVPSPY